MSAKCRMAKSSGSVLRSRLGRERAGCTGPHGAPPREGPILAKAGKAETPSCNASEQAEQIGTQRAGGKEAV